MGPRTLRMQRVLPIPSPLLTALTGALALALVTGCATPPSSPAAPPATGFQPPSGWGASVTPAATAVVGPQAPALDAVALSRWWQRFDDPLLGELVERAWVGNTDLAAARARLAQARALRDSQRASGSPQIGSGASVGRSRAQQVNSTAWQAGVDASWEADFFGAQAATLRGRELDVQAGRADLATARMTVAAEVGLAYVSLRATRAQLTIARDNLAAQEQTQSLTGWRAQAGLASSLDAQQARLSTEQLRAALPALELTIAQAEHRLAVLLGLPPTALRERLGLSDRVPVAGADLPVGLPAQVLALRPDVRSAELTLTAEAARLDASEARRRPTFTLGGSLALKAATLGQLSGPAALVAAVTAAVDWPIWDGGSRDAAVAAQLALREQAEVAWRAAVLTALEDVENALTALGATRRERQAREAAQAAAQNALLLARQRWQAGLIDFGTLLDAQRSALSAANSLAGAQADESLNLIRLYKALGGGWVEEGAAASDPARPATPLESAR